MITLNWKKTAITIILAVVGIVLIFVVHATYVVKNIDGAALDKESKEWVDSIAPQILASWDPQEIEKHASLAWLQTVPKKESEKFRSFAIENFGTLLKYGSSTGEAGIHVNNFNTTITAEYVIEADFTERHGRVFVQGIKEGNEWKIFSLHLDDKPDLRWFNGQLTTQKPLEKAGDSQEINGVHYLKVFDNE